MSKKQQPTTTKSEKKVDSDKWRDFNEREQAAQQEQNNEVEAEQATAGIEFPARGQLEDQLTALEKQVDEYKDLAMRARAEMENLRRRAERDVANAHKFGTERLIKDLIPVVDGMMRGLDSAEPDNPHSKSMREGISLTLDLLHKTLAKHGVEVIAPATGDAFNPTLHEAMSMAKDPDAKPSTILQVMQQGYQLNGRVLRAAMVVVAQ